MKRAVVYARVSDRKQAARDLPVESQIEACRRKAGELGAVVLEVYRDDGVTGRTEDRPGFVAALQHAIAVEADYLVVWDSARFARGVRIAETFKWQLESAGVRLVYAAMNIDRSTEEGWLADSFQQIIDEAKSRATSRDTKRSMILAASEGYFMGGRVPYGYRAVAVGKRRRLEPEPAEAAIVQSMFEHSERGVGAFAVAVMLNEQGLTLRGRPWGKNTVLGMLKSEVYMGEVVYNRFDRVHKRRRRPDEWVRVKSHEPLVSAERFDAVQRGLEQRTPADASVPGNTLHIFAGLVRCGLCGAGLKLTTGTGRSGKVYHYYGCQAAEQGRRKCRLKRLPADAFDRWLLDELLDRVLTCENVQQVLDHMDEAAADFSRQRRERRQALVKELRDAEERRTRLYEVLELQGKNAPGISDLAPRLREINERVKRIEASLVALEDEQGPPVIQSTVSAAHAAQVLRELVLECDSPPTLRAFVASLVDAVVVDEKEVRLDYRPECLIRHEGAAVRSTRNWLPVVGKLRTLVIALNPAAARFVA